ncbi:MAG TPA: preprotein translocase subunit SecG [Burkholderiaceae bacterium]|nr:preprotein translocase subunit SecG [Burkholderiaceae bacterium]
MSWLSSVFIVIQVISAVAIIVLVLLQHGKGADMGAAFGSGASGSLFGATGAANFLSRTTAVMAAVFFVATLVLAYTSTSMRAGRPAGGGLISSEPEKSATPPASKPGAEVPAAPAPADTAPKGDSKAAGAAATAAPPAAQPAPASDAKGGTSGSNEVPK